MLTIYSKMSYNATQLSLTQGQLGKLSSFQPQTLRLSAKALSSQGNTTVYLTNTQIAKIGRSISKGVGCQIAFSEKQIKYNAKVGSGFLGDAFKSVVKAVAPAAIDLAAGAAKNLIAKNVAGNGVIQNLDDNLVRAAIAGEHGTINELRKNWWLKRGGSMFKNQMTAQGQGFLGDAFKSVVKEVAPIAIDLAGTAAKNLIAKKVAGGGRRKQGKGVYAPGSRGNGIYAPQ